MKKYFAVIISIIFILSYAGSCLAADKFYISQSYEGIENVPWGSINGRMIASIETDPETENSYVKMEYNEQITQAPFYFEAIYPSNWLSSTLRMEDNIVMDFDFRFPGEDAGIYMRERNVDINKIVLRLCIKEGGKLMYGTNGGTGYFYDADGEVFYPGDKWYNAQIIANITTNEEEALQSIYITDLETGKIVTKVENVPLAATADYCNVLTVGSSDTMYFDNVTVMSPDITSITICGEPYPSRKSGELYKYDTRGVTSSGLILKRTNYFNPVWSIFNNVDGVSIDSATGELTISNNAKLSPVILKASYNDTASYYLVEIED